MFLYVTLCMNTDYICDQIFLIYLCFERAIKITLRPQAAVCRLVNHNAVVKHFPLVVVFTATNPQALTLFTGLLQFNQSHLLHNGLSNGSID